MELKTFFERFSFECFIAVGARATVFFNERSGADSNLVTFFSRAQILSMKGENPHV